MSQDITSDRTGDPQQDLETKSLQAHTGRFVCECGKSYMRKEHLKRHQTTHSSQAHKCHICGQSYLRKDVLQRHLTIHQDDSSPRRACDTCHANKTKCDGNGVSHCSFCKNKSIICTYSMRRSRTRKDAFPDNHDRIPQSDNNPSHATVTQPIPKTRLATIREAMSKSSMVKARSKSYKNALPPSVPSAATATEPSSSNGPDYLMTILHQLSASPPRSAPLQAKDASNSQRQWLEDDFQSYVDHFHHRWHIITAPTYELSEKPFDHAASIIMIGSYLSKRYGRNRVYIDVHCKLVENYIQLLGNVLESKRIPDTLRRLETYQSILMNIVFASVLGQEEILAKANSLCGLFIETLRATGFLNQSHAQQVLQTEFPGSYGPWIAMITDEWKRLVYNLLKVETRISLDCQQRPRLLYNELQTSLPSAFCVRNCYDMAVFLHRQRYESAGRDIGLSAMIKYPDQFLPNPLLVEDIHLGLCGLTVEILEHGHTRAMLNKSENAAKNAIRGSVLKRLSIWLAHIEDITQKISSDLLNPTDDSLLINYLAREDETQALSNGRTVVRQRIQDILSDATMLCHRLQGLLSSGNLIQ